VESFEEFKDSFSYGSRSDLSFKFLKRLSPEDAAEFFRRLLEEVGHTFDDGDLDRIHRLVYRAQVEGYAPDPGVTPAFVYESGPFAPLRRSLSECRVGLLTSSGHFTAGDDPRPFGIEDMSQEEAAARIDDFLRTAPELSEIHREVEADRLRVRHGGYDIRSADLDHNVTLPRDALVEAEAGGAIGEFAETMYSFVGAASQLRLRKHVLPEWIERFRADELDALLLVPV
jgi:hypothetical protein